jgi:hypothetical protein
VVHPLEASTQVSGFKMGSVGPESIGPGLRMSPVLLSGIYVQDLESNTRHHKTTQADWRRLLLSCFGGGRRDCGLVVRVDGLAELG